MKARPKGKLGNGMPKPVTRVGKNRSATGSKFKNRMRPTGKVR